MDMQIQNPVKTMALKILRPLVRMLIRQGVAHRTLEDYVREAYVLEGEEELLGNGGKVTVSSLAVLTGLSRKEVKRIKDSAADGEEGDAAQRHRIVRLLGAWSNHPDFSENGEGRALPIQGEQSFTELVKRFSGDMTPVSTLSLLEQSGNVLRVGDELFLIKKHYLPVQTPTQQLALFGTDVNELMQTIIHNLSSKHQERWFQRKVSNAQVSVDALAAFKQYAAEKSMALLEDYDEWLSKHEISNQAQQESDPQGEAAAYVTVGIYYLETPKQESES
ncbi:MAG: hypothetical protein RI942_2127 [Pseudomonadota bacterium]|jgi:hypothetical protein